MFRFRVVLLVVLLVAASCRASPVYDVVQVPFDTPRSVSMAELGRAIRAAASDRGWTTKYVSPGRIEARISARNLLAVVDITYDRRSFSIIYKDSRNLNYDGVNVHAKYNSWVRNLANQIRTVTAGL